MIALVLVLGALAVWRASNIIVDEEGPFELLTRLRDRIDPDQRTWLGRGIRCIWCVSFWGGWILAVYLYFAQVIDGWWLPVWALAFSGAAIGYHKLLGADRG